MGALEDLKRAGKIRAIGASNVAPADVEAYIAAGRLDAIQEQYSMVHRDIEADAAFRSALGHGVSILSYSSLALGLLTGKIGPERNFDGDDLRNRRSAVQRGNRRKVADLPPRSRPIAEAHGATIGRAGHRLDAAAARHHVCALRGTKSGPGEGECARRLDPARRS